MLTITNNNQQNPAFQARMKMNQNSKLIKHPLLTASTVSWTAGFSTASLLNRFMSGFFRIC